MDMQSKGVLDALLEKGVTKLHHANTVITSCQFLRKRALLSRGTIERSGLYQTPQASDAEDKRLSLWYDVFADSVDIHARAIKANAYGPVLFVLDVEKLRGKGHGRIWITKLNPTRWTGVPREERWFQSVGDVRDNFVYGTFNQMIVFRHCGGVLNFSEALDEIVLDDPQYETKSGLDLYSLACGALVLAAFEGKLSVPIHRRKCADDCKCLDYLKRYPGRTVEMFMPRMKLAA